MGMDAHERDSRASVPGDGKVSLARNVARGLTRRLEEIAVSLAQESESLYPGARREERTAIARTQAESLIRCVEEHRILTDLELSALAIPEFPTGSATFQA